MHGERYRPPDSPSHLSLKMQLAERRYPVAGQSDHFVWSVDSQRRITTISGGAARKINGLEIGVSVDELNADRPEIIAYIDRLMSGKDEAMEVAVDGVWWYMVGGPCWHRGKVVGCAGVTYAVRPKSTVERLRWKVEGPASGLHPALSLGDVILKTEGVSGVTKFNTHTDAEFVEWMVRSGRQLVPSHPSRSDRRLDARRLHLIR